jgi:hypothetical protein
LLVETTVVDWDRDKPGIQASLGLHREREGKARDIRAAIRVALLMERDNTSSFSLSSTFLSFFLYLF